MDKDRISIFSKENLFSVSSYLDDMNSGELLLKGLYSSAKAYLLSSVIKRGIHLVVLDNKENANGCANDLYQLSEEENIFLLPSSSARKIGNSVKDASMRVQRTAAIGAMLDYKNGKYPGKFLVLVTYKEALEEKVLNEKEISQSIIKIRKGDSISHEFLKDVLFNSNFTKVDFCSQPGEFAVRGGLIDIFSYGDNIPYRVDFFGDEVESIRHFDINTQRSSDELDEVSIYPNVVDNENDSESGKEKEYVDFFKLFPSDGVMWLSDADECRRDEFKTVYLSRISGESSGCATVEFNTVPQPSFNKNFALLSEDIKGRTKDGYKVYILSESKSQIGRLSNILENYGLKSVFLNYTIHEGFIDNDSKTCLYTDHQIFDRFRRLKIKRSVERSERLTINDINALKDGDYIVHIDHGVGRFGGLVKNNINGRIQEAIKLVYRDNDVIFVSIHGLHRISKYRSADATPPKINKLGTGAWEKVKSQTKSKVKDIAADLIKLYSQRMMSEGFAYGPDSYLQQELESSFKYEETPDQLKAVNAVKEDMEKPYPMDRLVCGDVGFGKTEVAMRAAFKAVDNSKQVAVLVPTTILALQHYNTFKERLKDMPCTIEYISRLRTAKEVKDIAARLSEGKIDIIIGTHRLLNKEIKFKDLGLLIIDEEQKFGVSAKERLRQLKLSVDTLTLSATPIPRTLQFSLLGARDLSIINTPPPNRQPIHTEIINFNEEFIRDIIESELERGGQIFFVHNRVEDIQSVDDIIRRICPGIRTCIAHGQMEPKVLEKKIMDYMAGDYDIMIATTIIENGIDIPNTNTIIINQAQNFGLSDLHQLRGRVGRSNKKAYCYLIVPPLISLSDDARRRVKAIEAFSDLGSGFNIAMQDLDIRGMGNMLGAQQSGYIADMGFETYQRILQEAFEEIKAESGVPVGGETSLGEEFVSDCQIDTDLSLLIPDSYVNVQAEKIRLYKELDSISDEQELKRFTDDLNDRFGTMPEEVRQLTYVVKLRNMAKKLGFEKIVLKNERLLAYFVSNPNSAFYKSDMFQHIMQYIQTKSQDRYRLKQADSKFYLVVTNVKTIEGACNLLSKFFEK